MKKEEIYFPDIKRLFLGNTPWEFMIEVALRTIVIYLVLLVVMRLLGKRMGAQITITEMAIMITLGGIVSLPMQSPDRGIVHGIVILFCVVIFQVGLGRLGFIKRKIELLTQGDLSLLVKDGIVNLKEMKKSGISHDQLYAELRSARKIQHLGEVSRVYLEACGIFSVFSNPDPKPGLSVLPILDEKLQENEYRIKDHYACRNCGNVVIYHNEPDYNCAICNETSWVAAVNTRKALKEAEQRKQMRTA